MSSFSKGTVHKPWTNLEPYMTAKHSFLHDNDRKTLTKLYNSLLEPGALKLDDDSQKLCNFLLCPTGTVRRNNADHSQYPFSVDDYIQRHPTIWKKFGLNDSHFELLKSLETGLEATFATLTIEAKATVVDWMRGLSKALINEMNSRKSHAIRVANYVTEPDRERSLPIDDWDRPKGPTREPENNHPVQREARGVTSSIQEELGKLDTMALFQRNLSRLEDYAQASETFKFEQIKGLVSCAWHQSTYTDHSGQKVPYTVDQYYKRRNEYWPGWGVKTNEKELAEALEKAINKRFPHHTPEREEISAWMTQETDKVEAKYRDQMSSRTEKLDEANRRLKEAQANGDDLDMVREELMEFLGHRNPKTELHDVQLESVPPDSQVIEKGIQTQAEAETDSLANKTSGASPGQTITRATDTTRLPENTTLDSSLVTDCEQETSAMPVQKANENDTPGFGHSAVPTTLEDPACSSNAQNRPLDSQSSQGLQHLSTASEESLNSSHPKAVSQSASAAATAHSSPSAPRQERLDFQPRADAPASIWATEFRKKFNDAVLSGAVTREAEGSAPIIWNGDKLSFTASHKDYTSTASCESNKRVLRVTYAVSKSDVPVWKVQQAWDLVGQGGHQIRVDWTGKKTSNTKRESVSQTFQHFNEVVQSTQLSGLLWPPPPWKSGSSDAIIDWNIKHEELPWTLLDHSS